MLGTSLQKRLRLEVLEEKIALASDLAVSLVNGDLIFTGDDNATSVGVGMFVESGNKFYRITAQDADDTITFNGVPVEDETPEGYPTLLVTGVTRDIRVNLGGGNDTIYLLGEYYNVGGVPMIQTYVPRDLVVNLGDGDDFVSVGVTNNMYEGDNYSPAAPTRVGRDVIITGGSGNDIGILSGAIIGDDLSVTDTQGDNLFEVYSKFIFMDPVEPDHYPLFDTVVAGDVSVTMGSGSDVVGIFTVVGGGNITANTGGGDDVAIVKDFSSQGSVIVNGGAGTNEVLVESGTVGGGILMTGTGTNIFQANLLDVASAIVMVGSSADDQFYFLTSNAGSAVLSSGGGADYVQLIDSAFDLLTVSLGAGNDTLYMDGVSATLAVLLGGGGSDTLLESVDNDFLLAIDSSFELSEAI